jgi:hypothetical protein
MNAPFLPAVGKSGATTRMSFFIYRNCVIEGLIKLGAKWPEGLDAWARIRHAGILARYNLGISPENAAQDLFIDHFRDRPACPRDSDRRVIHEACEDAKRRGKWNI